MAKKTKSKESGYVPFSREDINTSDERNTRAEELFLQMLDIPKKVLKKKKKGKEETIVDDDFYPTSMDELQRMEGMMMQVEAAIDDPTDKEFMDNVAYMKDIFAWSKKRHWEFAWWIVICVVIVAIYFFVQANNRKEAVTETKNWTEETLNARYNEHINSAKQNLEYHENRLAEATEKQEIKDITKSIESAQKYLDEEVEAGPEGYQKMILKYNKKKVRSANGSALWCLVWVVLYILAERPYGYMLSKRRTELKVYSGMRKALFGVAGALVGAAASMQVTETVTTWSDGSKTRDSDAGIVFALKIGFLLAAVVLVLFVARIVIVIATIMGFIRNYDLIALSKQASSKGKELTAKKAA